MRTVIQDSGVRLRSPSSPSPTSCSGQSRRCCSSSSATLLWLAWLKSRSRLDSPLTAVSQQCQHTHVHVPVHAVYKITIEILLCRCLRGRNSKFHLRCFRSWHGLLQLPPNRRHDRRLQSNRTTMQSMHSHTFNSSDVFVYIFLCRLPVASCMCRSAASSF